MFISTLSLRLSKAPPFVIEPPPRGDPPPGSPLCFIRVGQDSVTKNLEPFPQGHFGIIVRHIIIPVHI